MNLLRDKRDKEKPIDAADFSPVASEEPFPESSPTSEEPRFEKKPERKSKLGTLFMALVILVAAVLITYFGFYKPKEGGVVSESPPSLSQVDSTDKKVQDGSVTEESLEQDQIERTTMPMQQDGASSLRLASELLNTLQNAVSGTNRVTAFFLDEGTFSAEIAAGSVDGAKRVYDTIKSNLPANVTLTSSAPVSNSSALVSGSFTPQAASGGAELSADEIEQEIRQIASGATTTVSSLSIEPADDGQNFVVMRIEGSLESCRRFVERLAAKNLTVNVSKLILMPGTSGLYTFVLRFYL